MAAAVAEGTLLGIANPILDVMATVDEDFLAKYDVAMNTSSIAEERHLKLYDELSDAYNPTFIAGGSTQNTMRVAQWMMDVPGATNVIGSIGLDEHGDNMKHQISLNGVNASYHEVPNISTGTSAMLLNRAGERAMVVNFGASNCFDIEHFKEEKAQQFIANAKFVYVAGFFMMENLDSLLRIAKIAAKTEKTFAMNLSATFLVQFFGGSVMEILPFCDFVFCNESEAQAFGTMKSWGTDMAQVALKMAALPKASGTRPRIVVVTQGAGPTIVANQGVASAHPVEPLPNELLVDINGAGDSFVGGFLARLILGDEIEDCVRAGHWVARTVIQNSGCTFPKVCDYL